MIGVVISMTPPLPFTKLDVKKGGTVHPGGLIALRSLIYCLLRKIPGSTFGMM